MTLTTEEAERRAAHLHKFWGMDGVAAMIRSLAAERDALQARVAELEKALKRWIEADDEGDGHECTHALSDARKLVEGEKDEPGES